MVLTSRSALRKPAGVVLTVAMALLLSGCLVTSGHPTRANPNPINGPDPAAVATSDTTGQIYTTQANGQSIQTWGWNFATHTQIGGYGNALTLPSWTDGHSVWAPTVRKVGSRYLMFWSGTRPLHDQDNNCLGAAISTSPAGPFVGVTSGDFHPWCPAIGNVGYLDPALFYDQTTGKLWLYLSRQTYTDSDHAPTGDIDVVQLSSDGLSRVGTVYTIETYADVAANLGVCSDGGGPNPRLENPAMVVDPNIGYLLLASFGSYQDSCYETVEITCSAPNSGCESDAAHANVLNLKGDTTLSGTGGASLLFDFMTDYNYIVYAGYTGTAGGNQPRIPYSDSTSCYVDLSGQILSC